MYNSSYFSLFSYFALPQTEAVNLLALITNNQTSTAEISAHINQVVDQNDFTIMFTIRSKVHKCTQQKSLLSFFGIIRKEKTPNDE
jgi:hypothetical protein